MQCYLHADNVDSGQQVELSPLGAHVRRYFFPRHGSLHSSVVCLRKLCKYVLIWFRSILSKTYKMHIGEKTKTQTSLRTSVRALSCLCLYCSHSKFYKAKILYVRTTKGRTRPSKSTGFSWSVLGYNIIVQYRDYFYSPAAMWDKQDQYGIIMYCLTFH